MSNFLPKWLVLTLCALWVALILAGELVGVDPTRLGVRAPAVEAAMEACTNPDMHQRYECKEGAILANQRDMFVKTIGFIAELIGPPIILWFLTTRLHKADKRKSGRRDLGRPPPSIARWRVRWPASPAK